MIHDHSVALLEASHPRANALNDATGLMTTNYALVRFGARPPVSAPVDGTQIAPAER